MKRPAARLGVRVCTIAIALGVAIGLTGCLQAATPTAKPTSSAPASHTAAPTSKPTPTPSTTPTSAPTRFTESCTTLLSAAQLYAYNPNFVTDSGYAPKAGTIAAAIRAALGQNCGWVNETSKVELEVGVATPGSRGLAAARSAASGGSAISSNGEPGFFAVQNGIGSAQFFIGTLWLDVSSADFTVPQDAQPVYAVVVHNQMTAGG